MSYLDELEKKLRETSPAASLAVHIFADSYLEKAKGYERTGREIVGEVEKVVSGRGGEVYSNGVHRGADWGGSAAGAATGGLIIAAAVAVGSLMAGPLGGAVAGWLASGVAGAIGGAVANFVTGAIESVGKAVAGFLGIDYHSNGKTANGGTWSRTDHPDGSWDRLEKGPDFDVNERRGPDGSFTQDITGKGSHSGYKSHFHDDGKGNTRFEAVDKNGIFHNDNRFSDGQHAWGSANSHDTDRSNGKDGQHVSTQGNDGAKSDLWFYKDGSTKESHTSPPHSNGDGTVTRDTVTTEKDKNGNTTRETRESTTTDDKGNTTTVTTTTDKDGNQDSKVESKDKHGHENHPPQPPPGESSGRDNPEGNGSEGPPFNPGDFGKVRPGHPMDFVTSPKSWKKDNGDWGSEQPPQYRDVLAGIIIVLHPPAYSGDGESADGQAEIEALKRKLGEIYVEKAGSGEDFIHPKAKAEMLNMMFRSVI